MRLSWKYLFVFLACMFISPLVTHAECSYARQADLSKLAANVQFNYTYELRKEGFIFYIHITNITKDIYVYDNYNERALRKDATIEFNGFDVTMNYDIYSRDKNCKNQKLLTSYITLPYYNPYSTTESCKKYPQIEECQTWLNTQNITQKEFDTKVNAYVDNLTKIVGKEQSQNGKILEFLKENVKILIIMGIVLLLLLGIFIAKRRKG